MQRITNSGASALMFLRQKATQQTRQYTLKHQNKIISSKKLGDINRSVPTSLGYMVPSLYSVHNGVIQISKLEGSDTIPRLQSKEIKGNVVAPIHRGKENFTETHVQKGKELFGISNCENSNNLRGWVLEAQHFTGTPTGDYEKGKTTNLVRPKTKYQGGDVGDLASFDKHTAVGQSVIEQTQKSGIDDSELIFVPVNHPAIKKNTLLKEVLKNIKIKSSLSSLDYDLVTRKHGRSEFECIISLQEIIKDKEDGVFCIHANSLLKKCSELHEFFNQSTPKEGSFCIRSTSDLDEFNEPVFNLIPTKFVPPVNDKFEVIAPVEFDD